MAKTEAIPELQNAEHFGQHESLTRFVYISAFPCLHFFVLKLLLFLFTRAPDLLIVWPCLDLH